MSSAHSRTQSQNHDEEQVREYLYLKRNLERHPYHEAAQEIEAAQRRSQTGVSGAPQDEDPGAIFEEVAKLRDEVDRLRAEVKEFRRSRESSIHVHSMIEDPKIYALVSLRDISDQDRVAYIRWRWLMSAKLEEMASLTEATRINYVLSRTSGSKFFDLISHLSEVQLIAGEKRRGNVVRTAQGVLEVLDGWYTPKAIPPAVIPIR